MAVTTDIVASYRNPRAVVRRLAAGPEQEARLLAYVMLGCLLIFVAQLPRLSREATLDPARDIAERASGEVLFWMLMAPLAFYAIGGLVHLVCKALGGRGTFYRARLATFWALVAAGPLWLLRGVVAGFLGPGIQLDIIGTVALIGFAVIWGLGLREAEWPSTIAVDENVT